MANGSTNDDSHGLSTFAGVFTPSVLTILGVIMYLRFGWVVGNAGITGTLTIVTLSTAITFLTALSIAEIATDKVVRVGGAYYMVSRSLGIETGGAVGIPLYFAQALSVALYTIGFADSLAAVFPVLDTRWTALLTTVLVTALALRSASFAIRAQYFIMAAIGLSLVSFFLGGPVDPAAIDIAAPGAGAPASNPGFWVVFAVFFPAVTGIMAGVSMSGDLENPTVSIPRGTLAAVLVGYIAYMTIPFALSAWATPEQLRADPLIMQRMALWGPAIMIGVWGATLSSALGSILGAPRVLQALARDGVLPRFLAVLGRGTGPNDEPRIGTFVTLAVASTAVMLGSLDAIAPVLTMFFLTTYLVLNLVAGIERFLDSPSFRPAFRVHWSLSIAAAVGCLAVMFLINPVATVLAGAVILGVYVWLERREMSAAWGDVRRGMWMAMLRTGLLRADRRVEDPRSWRPHVLVLAGAPTKRWRLIQFAADIGHNRTLMTVASVLPRGSVRPGRRLEMAETVKDFLQKKGVHALVRIVDAEKRHEGIRQFVESYGLGSVVPNTVVMGTSTDDESFTAYADLVASLHAARRNLIVFSEGDGRGHGARGRIDVWWGGLHKNGGLMMVLAYLLRSGVRWHHANVNLKLVVDNQEARAPALANLERIAAELRFGAEPEVIVGGGKPFPQILQESSALADIVFLGLAEPSEQYAAYLREAFDRAARMPPTAFVLASEDLKFGEVLLDRFRGVAD